ncbi:MAG TPA: hypothetical protein VGQ90_16875 [Stellaceae bacterium]|nr:hypothetical protein [Stellaceae bacterium]
MNATNYYRGRAEHYRCAAEEADNPDLREQLQNLAGDYDELARDSERGLLTDQQLEALRQAGRLAC